MAFILTSGGDAIHCDTKWPKPRVAGKLDGVRYFVEPRGRRWAVVERRIDRQLNIDGERDVAVVSNEQMAEALARRLGGAQP